MKNLTYQELTDLQRRALDAAEKVMENSYSPYSKFLVGAALFAENGTIISGANFENASYGLSICAEKAAIARANAIGCRKFDGIAIIARGTNFHTVTVTSPCGACRQMLYELAELSGTKTKFEIILSTTRKEKIIVATIEELLPLAFGPEDFGINITEYQK